MLATCCDIAAGLSRDLQHSNLRSVGESCGVIDASALKLRRRVSTINLQLRPVSRFVGADSAEGARTRRAGKKQRARKKKVAAPNDASETASAAPAAAPEPTPSAPFLDTSDAGMPALRSSAPLGTAEGPPGPPSDEELIVEIELAPGAVSLRPASIRQYRGVHGRGSSGSGSPGNRTRRRSCAATG